MMILIIQQNKIWGTQVINKLSAVTSIIITQIIICFVFIVLMGFLPLTTSALLLYHIVWLSLGAAIFYLLGFHANNSSKLNRYGLFILQALLCILIAIRQGTQFGDMLTLMVNFLFRYSLPLFQIACLLGYNLGIYRRKRLP